MRMPGLIVMMVSSPCFRGSATGNQTPVSHETGRDTSNYYLVSSTQTSAWTVPALILIVVVQADDIKEGRDAPPPPIPPPKTAHPCRVGGAVTAVSTDTESPRAPPERVVKGSARASDHNVGVGMVVDARDMTEGDGTMVIPSSRLAAASTSALCTSKSNEGRTSGVQRER